MMSQVYMLYIFKLLACLVSPALGWDPWKSFCRTRSQNRFVSSPSMEVLSHNIIRKYLLGVPYTSHDDLMVFFRIWEGIVNSPRFYPDINISGNSDQLIWLLHKDPKAVGSKLVITINDPFNDTLRRLTPISDSHFNGLSIIP